MKLADCQNSYTCRGVVSSAYIWIKHINTSVRLQT